ncbi:MAG: protein of unknown function (DUF354) [Bacteriophage sp.]|jgi:hypothetical protein|nr:MAG: protein of unknown function DUF354 [Bacteriophage sp.]UVX33262.1 MAG: protein of unknown function (DUF354) [Bacteriophage sp.]UVY03302.1 MAG: Protein of unknown function (DUF354) [Bacteriophage sp.]UWF79179.1 MAG: Protein of unknown function (DUF354) [Bacteriophage sp.]UWF82275.1 MAG: Protein of unknown function (DUF354) [Bacteriophage sp.]
MDNTKEIVQRIETEIGKLKDKSFKVLFYVPDAKNNATGYISYIYQMALTLQQLGYNVKMLYQLDNEYTAEELKKLNLENQPIDDNRVFVGVTESLGEKYATLEHANIQNEELEVSPSDFLIIPEVYSSVMNQTKKLSCKRIVLTQNYNYLTDFIQVGVSWANFGITDTITSCLNQAELVNSVFPYVKTKVLTPYIPSYFYEGNEPKKLIVNIITKSQKDANKIIKPFYWKYPMYKWVSFRDLRSYPREMFADYLREGAITIWVDSDTQFGYAPLEAIKSGNIVIGKIPELIPEWMLSEDKTQLLDNGIWFNDINSVHKIIADVIRTWINDDIPSEITDAMKETAKKYSFDEYKVNLDNLINSYINERVKEFEEVIIVAKSKINDEKVEE